MLPSIIFFGLMLVLTVTNLFRSKTKKTRNWSLVGVITSVIAIVSNIIIHTLRNY
jgi:hypothetical protein